MKFKPDPVGPVYDAARKYAPLPPADHFQTADMTIAQFKQEAFIDGAAWQAAEQSRQGTALERFHIWLAGEAEKAAHNWTLSENSTVHQMIGLLNRAAIYADILGVLEKFIAEDKEP